VRAETAAIYEDEGGAGDGDGDEDGYEDEHDD
jgi:hypothetical protein